MEVDGLKIFEKHFISKMKNKDFKSFAKTHPTLIKCIVGAIADVSRYSTKYWKNPKKELPVCWDISAYINYTRSSLVICIDDKKNVFISRYFKNEDTGEGFWMENKKVIGWKETPEIII